MSAPYNLTNLTSGDSFVSILTASNELTNGWIANFVVIMIFLVSYVALKNYDTNSAFAASCFGTTILMLVLNTMVPIHFTIQMAFFIGTAISVVGLFLNPGYGVA